MSFNDPNPLLSVIIPTCNRPQFLSRAIDSALLAVPEGAFVEVIVVPNGPSESWKETLSQYREDPRVQWHPIVKAHANAARNHGLSIATGEYVRFLDDDDYFYPEMAREQLNAVINSGADLSFGHIKVVEEGALDGEERGFLETDDFVTAVLMPRLAAVPVALVYKREITVGLEWDVSINKNQDLYWAMSLCKGREINTIKFSEAVGAWVQHDMPRVSKGHHPSLISRQTAEHILEIVKSLSEQDRLTKSRARAAAIHLWQRLHQGLMYQPFFWMGVSRQAERICPGCCPPKVMYEWPIIRRFHPLLIEFSIVPWRWLRVLFGHKYTV